MTDTTMLPHIKLRFNIDYPTLEESYIHGYEQAVAGINENENPFAAGSIENDHWAEGWWAGFYGDEPLFALPAVDLDAEHLPANEHAYHDHETEESFFVKFLEISGVIAVSAFVGYQLLELVA